MPTIYLSERELSALTQALEDVEHEILRSALIKLQRAEHKHEKAKRWLEMWQPGKSKTPQVREESL